MHFQIGRFPWAGYTIVGGVCVRCATALSLLIQLPLSTIGSVRISKLAWTLLTKIEDCDGGRARQRPGSHPRCVLETSLALSEVD
jgi:hypothetical protein